MAGRYRDSGDSRLFPMSHERPLYQGPHQSGERPYVPYQESDSMFGESGETLRDYIAVVLRRKLIVLSVFVVIFSLVVGYTATCTRYFTSVAVLEFEEKKPKQQESVLAKPEYDQYKGYLATQLEILKSRTMAETLVTRMNLLESPEFAAKQSKIGWIIQWVMAPVSWLGGTGDKQTGQDLATVKKNGVAGQVLSRVSVKPVKTSNLAQISMIGKSPAAASEMLRNYLDIYLEKNLQTRRKESLEAAAFLKEELAKVENKLMASQAELVGFLIDNGIVSSSTETGVSPVMDLLNKTIESHVKSREARLRMQALKDQRMSDEGAVLPKNVGTEYIGKLKGQLALYESEYSEMKGVYSPGYPKMAMLAQKIKFLKDRIVEIEKSVVATSLDTAKKEEKLFLGSVDVAKAEANRVKALDAQHMLLKKEVETNEEFHKIILKEYKENDIKARSTSNNVRIVDPPSVPMGPSWPKKSMLLLAGTFMALVGGIAAAFIMDRMDNTIQSPEEIERDFRVRRLAIIPDIGKLGKLQGGRVNPSRYEFLAHDRPKSPMSDAIRNLQASIFLSGSARPVRCMVVSSPGPSQGKTLISVSMASVLCSGDKKVALIDADMRKPRIHSVFGHPQPGLGLSSLLSGKGARLSQVLHAHSIKGLFYVTAGPQVSDHLPLIQSELMKSLVAELRDSFHYIVFDSPPILGFSDTPTICTYADGLIMIAKQGAVGREEMREAINATSAVNACAILGIVLNKAHGHGGSYGYYHANYKYYGDSC
ncbi:MAG: polysaccharide biosynthesis tyrosine autokinase [Desulfomonilaceae bacterium]